MIANCGYLVFVRRNGAHGLGHVGWGFRRPSDGAFNIGAVENDPGTAITDTTSMDFWTVWTNDPLAYLGPAKGAQRYDFYKFVPVDLNNVVDAAKVVVWIAQQAYCVASRNCMDDAYDVIRAYGGEKLLTPSDVIFPNTWFDSLPGIACPIGDPSAIPMPLGGPEPLGGMPLLSDFATLDKALTSAELNMMPSMAPSWRVHNTQAALQLEGAVKAQRQLRIQADQSHTTDLINQQSNRLNIEVQLQRALTSLGTLC